VKGVHVYLRSGRRLALLPGSFNNKSSARYQLLLKIFPQRIKEDILNKTMNQVIMPPFGGAFGLPHANPVGGLVAGSPEAIFFHEGFQEIDWLLVDRRPIRRDFPGIHGQNFGSQTFDGNPGQNKESSIINHKREVFLLGGFVPADEGFSGLDRPGGRTPSDTGHRAIAEKGQIFQMLTDDLVVTEIMILMNEAVVEGLQGGVPDHGHCDGTVISKTSFQRRLIHENRRNEAISFFIPTVMLTARQFEMPLSFQGNQHLPAGHVFESAIGLSPVPSLAEHSGDGAAAVVPMLINNVLDDGQVDLANCPVSNGDGQHAYRISKRIRGRQLKMQGDENIFSGELLPGNLAGGVGC
jgi:hypothetical protein